jgi:iron complex transport system substrate-binding protein
MRDQPPVLSSFRACGVALLLALAAFLGEARAEAAAKPRRIVSVNLCTDQLLIDLVSRDRIAAVTHLAADPSVSAIPEKARGLPVTHGGAEDVLSHDPDLILAGPWGVAETVSLLKRLGRNVVTVPLAPDLAGVRTAIATVAKAVGEEEAGARAIAAFNARLQRVSQAVTPAGAGASRPAALIYQVGGSASAPGTLADAAVEAAGFRNAAASYAAARNGQVPLEAIVARPPDVLVLASPPYAYRTVVADNLRHPALKALTEKLPSLTMPWRLWLCGTPHVATAIEQLAAARTAAARGAP